MHNNNSSQDEERSAETAPQVKHARDDATLVSTALTHLSWNLAGDGAMYVGPRSLDPVQRLVLATAVLATWNTCDRDPDRAAAAMADWLATRNVSLQLGGPVTSGTKLELARLRRLVTAVWVDLQAWADAGEPA